MSLSPFGEPQETATEGESLRVKLPRSTLHGPARHHQQLRRSVESSLAGQVIHEGGP